MSLLLLFQNRSSTQPSGGWRRASPRPGHWPREETESERAALLAERIRLGIIEAEPAPPPPTEAHSEPAAAALFGSPTTAQAADLRRLARLSAQAEALSAANVALEAAGLRTGAKLDEEIGLYLRLIEARRLHRLREDAEWLLLFE